MKLLAVFLILLCNMLHGAEFTAASAERADVIAARDLATTSGDVIVIPAGTGDWTSAGITTIADGVTWRGQGVGVTILNITAGGLRVPNDNNRVTGIEFRSNGTSTSHYHVKAESDVWYEIDNCKFVSTVSNKQIGVHAVSASGGGDPLGLVWECEFVNTRFLNQGDLGTGFGRDVWGDALIKPGSQYSNFVEDCTFTNSAGGNSFDNEYGGNYVARFNSITDSTFEAHGITSTGERGNKVVEVYGNTLTKGANEYYRPFFLRGGTALVFDNSFTGPWNQQIEIDSETNRNTDAFGAVAANGNQTPADGSGDGTHTGSNNASTLTDSTKSGTWTTDSWVQTITASVSKNRWFVRNVTDGSDWVEITANSTTTVTATLTGGTDNDWDTGDTYEISDGYPWRDQIGTGTDAFEYTGTPPWPAQAHWPFYQWNNIHDGVGKHAAWPDTIADFVRANNTGNQQVTAQLNRDYFNYTTSFDGTAGVGMGTAAQMAAITPTTDKVAFWVTDEGEWNSTNGSAPDGRLYQWDGDSWELYYTPYAYPHPLRSAAAASTVRPRTPAKARRNVLIR